MDATILVPVGLGLTVIGAGLGIGKFAAAAAEGIARQPEALIKSAEQFNCHSFFWKA